MKKKSLFLKIFLPILALVTVGAGIYLFTRPRGELRNIGSDAELYSFYERDVSSPSDNLLLYFLTWPFSGLIGGGRDYCYDCDYYIDDVAEDWGIDISGSESIKGRTNSYSESDKDFSTTNIQVENVDEADIIKTDGDYTYSISGSDVIITDVKNTESPEIAARIESTDESIPEDLILTDNTLTIISAEVNSSRRLYYNYSRYYSEDNTVVRVYDISDRKNPRLEKNYKLYQPYYTSRRIDDKLYVIASGRLRKKGSEKLVNRSYYEDYVEKEFPATSVRYLKDTLSDRLTLISVVDLKNLDADITLNPFLIDIENAYVSETAFYLLDEKYERNDSSNFWDDMKALFGLKGVIGYIDYKRDNSSYSGSTLQTEIYKFDIENSGNISYSANTKISGTTVNQYSLDEKDGHLRIALKDREGSYVAILDEKLNKLGESGRLAKNEIMYATRFIGDKAYLVTYKNTDPLFVIDLADERNPKVLGELKIPGYSTYLHPYDETHLIGIGVDTEETTIKDINGRVIRTTAYVTGMKLALFDISDFKNPKEISKLHIGDSRTSSAILTNPKALLFSKEKQLLAIPVNNYQSDFKIEIDEDDDLSDLDSYFYDYDDYVDEGYLIYSITADGITERGEIVHEDSDLVRGLYIEDDLLTISESKLKINKLSDLSLKAELDLTKE